MPLFYMLASFRSLAIFKNQTVAMHRRFKQWYLLCLTLVANDDPEWKKAAFVFADCAVVAICFTTNSHLLNREMKSPVLDIKSE